MKELTEIAKILQPALEKWAGGGNCGARVWLTEFLYEAAIL